MTRNVAILSCLAVAGLARGADWPQWLGPGRDGVWREQGVIERFPKEGAVVRWRVKLGPGYTGPAVVGGRVYVMDRQRPAGPLPPPPPRVEGHPPKPREIPGTERLLCLDAATGKELWKDEYPCTYQLAVPTGPRTTPVVHAGKVYTLGAMGDLRCLDAKTGGLHWGLKFVRDLKAPVPVWGWAAHPVVEGDLLYCLVGGKGQAVVAFDRNTGKEMWKSLTAEEVCYAPPAILTAGGKRQLVVFLDDAVAGLDPASGKVYWTRRYPSKGVVQRPAVSIAAPRHEGDLLLVSSFYHGSLMLKLAADKPDAAVLWESTSPNPQRPDKLNTVMGTPVIKDGHVYGVCGMGELRCLDAKTGKQIWHTYDATSKKKAFMATAFLVEQGDRFWLFNDQGDLIVARITPKGYEEISRAHVIEPSQDGRGREVVWSHPAFAGRCAFVRNDKEIVCVSLAAK